MKKIFIYIFIFICTIIAIGCKNVNSNYIENIKLIKTEGFEYTYLVTYSDGSTVEVKVKNEEKEEKPTSVVNVYVDDKYHLIVVLSNGDTIDAGYVGVEVKNNKKQYIVVFKNYDETILKSMIVEEGNSVEAPEVPLREGYQFIGWDESFDNVTGDLIVTAKYEKIKDETNVFKISYKDNGDGTITVTVSVTGDNVVYAGIDGYLLFDSSQLTVKEVKKTTRMSGIINPQQKDSKVYIALASNENNEDSEDLFTVTFSYDGNVNTSLSLIIEDIFDADFNTQKYSTNDIQIEVK